MHSSAAIPPLWFLILPTYFRTARAIYVYGCDTESQRDIWIDVLQRAKAADPGRRLGGAVMSKFDSVADVLDSAVKKMTKRRSTAGDSLAPEAGRLSALQRDTAVLQGRT